MATYTGSLGDDSGISLRPTAVANLVSVMAGFAPQDLSGATGTLAAARDACLDHRLKTIIKSQEFICDSHHAC